MGGNWSTQEREPSPDLWWPAAQPCPDTFTADQEVEKEVFVLAEAAERKRKGQVKQEELDAFKQELASKRALRHVALAALQTELRDLRSKVEQEHNQRIQAEQERDRLRTNTEHELKQELVREREEKMNLLEEREKLLEEVEQKAALEKQVQALKDVSEIGKEMLRIRELQVKELKKKLVEINISSVTAPPEDLRIEYEKQIDNIRKLRTLYEERAAATLLEHKRELEREEAKINVLETKLSDLQKEKDDFKEAKDDLEDKIKKLENTIQTKEDELETTKDQLFSSIVQNKNLNSHMKVINTLFSEMIVSPKVDLDRLTRLLKENHGLITDLTEKGDSNEVAALLVDLAGQVEKEHEEEILSEQQSLMDSINTYDQQNKESDSKNHNLQSEIASNLSKVWRVIIELLSHHQSSDHTEVANGSESCYKCIQTPSGPRSVISVSQTFLTLKDLILEKNRLVKEVSRLKTLNSHLEHRLGSQEKRLLVVTTELRKTWGVVNKLRAQHKQLHTHEKILRYELQQKRCMLNELKEELDHCKDKWEQARQKNSQTEEDWKKLRKEFAARKTRKESNSAESGYEEEDVAQSPPSEPVNHEVNLFKIRQNEGSETELSEEDIEHSDGNSFDTVIDLLDIACIENNSEVESDIPFALREAPPQTTEISAGLLPLSGSEFTDGLDQIESEDLAAVLDIQYQNQLLGADYNLSLPSSSGSSPVPTENDDFASSEMDVSEEDSSLNDNHIYTTPLPIGEQTVSEEKLLFGSNSSKNISKFLEGLFIEHEHSGTIPSSPQKLQLEVPSTSQMDEDSSSTPLVNNENCYQFPDEHKALLPNNNSCSEIQADVVKESLQDQVVRGKLEEIGQVKGLNDDSKVLYLGNMQTTSGSSLAPPALNATLETATLSQEELLNAREERLKKLEQQCRSLVSKVMSTTFRSEILSNKLDELHLSYGSSEETSDIEDESSFKAKEVMPTITQHIEVTQLPSVHSNSTPPDIDADTSCLINNEKATPKGKSPQEVLQVRAARLKRLEDQCKSLFSKMSATSSRSETIPNKLNELHESHRSFESTHINQPSTSKVLIPATGAESSDICEANDKTKFCLLSQKEKDSTRLPDLVSESKEILNQCSLPEPSLETSTSIVDPKKDRTPEEILQARAERFKRLEDQCKSLVSKMTATSLRSEIISNKLDELHSCYGSSESTSDNDEHSLSSNEGRKRTPQNSSPRHNRKAISGLEKINPIDVLSDNNSNTNNNENIIDRVNFLQTPNFQSENKDDSQTDKADRIKRTPDEILQARAERLDRLEEQCKSLFSKMSATSHRSDELSNRLEELHEQYGQPSTSDEGFHCQDIASEQNKIYDTSSTERNPNGMQSLSSEYIPSQSSTETSPEMSTKCPNEETTRKQNQGNN